jgi:hypothetical protein
MTAGKRQHYVPRFYCRGFSGRDAVEVYDLKDKRFYSAGCNNICVEDFFYSRDTLIETGPLSTLDAECSRVFNKLCSSRDLAGLTKEEYHLMRFFLIFQNSRTAKSKKDSEDYVNSFFKEISKDLLKKNIGKFPWLTEEYIETHEMPTISGPTHLIFLSKALSTGSLLISDLVPLILKNNTGMDFVFSDAPVVFYNSFFNDKNGQGSTYSTSPGLQIFCPLNPKTMLMLYDPKFYNFDNTHDHIVEITSERDINALNALQYFNCKECIFFVDNSHSQKSAISTLHASLEDSIKDSFFEIETFSLPGGPSGLGRDFILSGKHDINYTLSLSFMVFNPDVGPVGTPLDDAQPFRDYRLVQKAKTIDAQLEKKLNESFE